eukprot:TRINITY_DN1566_c0_g2_i1.p1 TRINITY_DN1566_c0_g2~~TRINITY_DN1566_c0_g2_i1.p1  ORF type:complete len:388 (+),score=129.54 TRINITY_DN1566_c0_g2_i1:81-1244(+)
MMPPHPEPVDPPTAGGGLWRNPVYAYMTVGKVNSRGWEDERLVVVARLFTAFCKPKGEQQRVIVHDDLEKIIWQSQGGSSGKTYVLFQMKASCNEPDVVVTMNEKTYAKPRQPQSFKHFLHVLQALKKHRPGAPDLAVEEVSIHDVKKFTKLAKRTGTKQKPMHRLIASITESPRRREQVLASQRGSAVPSDGPAGLRCLSPPAHTLQRINSDPYRTGGAAAAAAPPPPVEHPCISPAQPGMLSPPYPYPRQVDGRMTSPRRESLREGARRDPLADIFNTPPRYASPRGLFGGYDGRYGRGLSDHAAHIAGSGGGGGGGGGALVSPLPVGGPHTPPGALASRGVTSLSPDNRERLEQADWLEKSAAALRSRVENAVGSPGRQSSRRH